MNLESFLIKVVEKTNGWVIVVIFLIYVVYHIYKKYTEGAALKQTLNILEGSIQRLLENIDQNIRTLSNRIENLINRLAI